MIPLVQSCSATSAKTHPVREEQLQTVWLLMTSRLPQTGSAAVKIKLANSRPSLRPTDPRKQPMPTSTLDETTYRTLRARLIDSGYADDIVWSQELQPVSNPLAFWKEYAFVVLNSGMKNTVAMGIWRKVQPVVEGGGSASQVFGHVGKAAGIDRVYRDREHLLGEYLSSDDKLDYLRGLPWIGKITCYHLAKNFGLDCAKPDRHLARIAGVEGTHPLCARLAGLTGDRVATVDYVIWRAASLGWVSP